VVLAGDSTMAPRTGYGDALCGLFKWQVECANLARGGRSTKSFRGDGSWDRVAVHLRDRAGRGPTYVLVQFGHNDQPGKAERTTDLATEFPANLRRYVEEIRGAGAIPVLVTPLTRRQFDNEGRLKTDLSPWAEATRTVAKELDVPLLDLYADSVATVSRMGAARADELAMAPPPDRTFDHTHLGPRGAALFANLVAREIAQAVPGLAAHFVVGAVELQGRVARPQLAAAHAKDYSYREVLGGWDPLSGPLAKGTPLKADYIVDRDRPDGQRTFGTVQAAVNAALRSAKEGGAARAHILLRPGIHEGLVYIPDSPVAITLYGEGSDPTAVRIRAKLDALVTGEDYARTFGAAFADAPAPVAAMFATLKARPTVGTPGSAIAWVRQSGFEARNLTLENAYNKDRGDRLDHSQAVALLLEDADRAHLENVRLLGYQDTFFLAASSWERPARAFIHRSYIEGDMDFIFGEATGYFRDTEIRTLGDRAVSYTLAPSTHYKRRFGFVFDACRFTNDGSPHAMAGTFKLARQWNRATEAVGKVAILNSSIGAHIDPVRPWADWSIGTPRYRPVQYDSGEHWDRLVAAGVDPQRDLGYPARRQPDEPFLVEYDNR
jgi:pectin methylesterase-like acyl-CoA thioesterase